MAEVDVDWGGGEGEGDEGAVAGYVGHFGVVERMKRELEMKAMMKL